MIVPVRHARDTGRSSRLPEDVRNRIRAFPRKLPAGIAYRETRVISPRESPGRVPRASKSPRNWLYVRTKLTGQLVRLNRQTYRAGCGAGAALRVIRLLCSRPLTLLRSCTHARTHTHCINKYCLLLQDRLFGSSFSVSLVLYPLCVLRGGRIRPVLVFAPILK